MENHDEDWNEVEKMVDRLEAAIDNQADTKDYKSELFTPQQLEKLRRLNAEAIADGRISEYPKMSIKQPLKFILPKGFYDSIYIDKTIIC